MKNFRIGQFSSFCFSKQQRHGLKIKVKRTVLTVEENLLQTSRTMFRSEQDNVACVSQLFEFLVVNVGFLIKFRNLANLLVFVFLSIRVLYGLFYCLSPFARMRFLQGIEIKSFITGFKSDLKPVLFISNVCINSIKVEVISQLITHINTQNRVF